MAMMLLLSTAMLGSLLLPLAPFQPHTDTAQSAWWGAHALACTCSPLSTTNPGCHSFIPAAG